MWLISKCPYNTQAKGIPSTIPRDPINDHKKIHSSK